MCQTVKEFIQNTKKANYATRGFHLCVFNSGLFIVIRMEVEAKEDFQATKEQPKYASAHYGGTDRVEYNTL